MFKQNDMIRARCCRFCMLKENNKVNKLEPWHIVYILHQMTKPSNLHLIDRRQFPWLTASLVQLN